jgi:hypothetical protein
MHVHFKFSDDLADSSERRAHLWVSSFCGTRINACLAASERGQVFEGMEIAPGSVELASVSQAVESEISGVPYSHRKMKVTPLAAR